MASALQQLQGVQGKLAVSMSVRRSLHHCKSQIGFAAFGAPVCARRVWGNRVAFSVTTCKASTSDVIEKNATENGMVSSEGETSFTCVMKFGFLMSYFFYNLNCVYIHFSSFIKACD